MRAGRLMLMSLLLIFLLGAVFILLELMSLS
jgi:hypothetical protein